MAPESATSSDTGIAPREYWCFISYRHADNKQPGRQWASWLHHSLETYEVPADLIGTRNLRDDLIPERIYPVFRDEEELPADAELSRPIEQAIHKSKFMIVLCSPHAVVSRFVAEEIVQFKAHHPDNKDRILAAIIAGSPAGEEVTDIKEKSDIPYASRQCFPRPLRFVVAPDGTVTDIPAEPIAPDFRLSDDTEGFTSPAAYRQSLGSAATDEAVAHFEKRLEQMKLKIIAGILGVPLGILTARDKAYQLEKERARLRTLRRWLAVVAVLTALALTGGIVAWQQRGVAKEKQTLAETNEQKAIAGLKEASRSDTATAQQRLAEGKWQEAVAYLGRAVRYDPENQNARDALWLTVRYGLPDASPLLVRSFAHPNGTRGAAYSPDNSLIVTTGNDYTARLWDAETGQPVGDPMVHKETDLRVILGEDMARGRFPNLSGQAGRSFADSMVMDSMKESFQGELKVHFSPNGRRLATVGTDYTVRLWDGKTGRATGTVIRHSNLVNSVAFSPDSTRLVTAGMDGTARVWDAATGQPAGAALTHPSSVRAALYSPDGTSILVVSENSARVWDATLTNKTGAVVMHRGSIDSAAFSPDGTRLLTTGWDEAGQVWNARTGEAIGRPMQVQGLFKQAAFSPDGTLVVTVGSRIARLWHADTGQSTGADMEHKGNIASVSFSPDSTRLITAGGDNLARMWDATTGHAQAAPLSHPGTVRAASFNARGTRVLTVSFDGDARVWEARSISSPGVILPHLDDVHSARFSPDGARVVTASGDAARVWDVKNTQTLLSLAHSSYVKSADYHPDGSRIVTASWDKTARVWDAVTGQPAGPVLPHGAYVERVRFSPDGSRIVTGTRTKTLGTLDGPSPTEDNAARVWDAGTGGKLGQLMQHADDVINVSFSLDGTRIVTASNDRTARMWDASSGRPIGLPIKHRQSLFDAVFSPDGTRILTTSGGDSSARLWYTDSGLPAGSLPDEFVARCVAYSPDGSWIATGGILTARLWEARTGQRIGSSLSRLAHIESVSFSPDGNSLLTAGGDHTARIRDVRSRQAPAGEIAPRLAAICSGAELDPQLGTLRMITAEARLALWKELAPALASLDEWRFAAAATLPGDPAAIAVSLRQPMTIRQAATALIRTMDSDAIREVPGLDPGHPLVTFAYARIAAEKPAIGDPNRVRAAWLIQYGLTGLRENIGPADLRLAARLVAEVSKTLPEHKATAVSLLDRAAKLSPEDEETKQLRAALK